MKQAILITGYKDVESLIEIIELFNNNFNFYLHLDKKSNLDLSPFADYHNVFITSAYKINWGGINHLKAILLLCQKAIENVENVFFHLITAEDYPSKTTAEFAALDLGKNYIDFFKIPNANWDGNGGMDRLDFYNLFDKINAKRKFRLHIIKNLIKLQKFLNMKRNYTKEFLSLSLFGGSTYWSLNRGALMYVVNYTSKNNEILERFNHTFCAEEFYFQTILLNSSFASSVVNDNLRYVDWSSGRGGKPAFLDESDFKKIISSNKIFVRKLNTSTSNKLKIQLKDFLLH